MEKLIIATSWKLYGTKKNSAMAEGPRDFLHHAKPCHIVLTIIVRTFFSGEGRTIVYI